MKKLYIKQKVFSLKGQFTVIDEQQRDVYFIEGSFMQIPKSYMISNDKREEIACVKKVLWSLLAKFEVDIYNDISFVIKQQWSFLKARYTIDSANITIDGNLLDMDFSVHQNGEKIGFVRKQWFTWSDTYEINIIDPKMEVLLISLVVAIDCVKASESAGNSAMNSTM